MKELITATTISDARKAGLAHIYVSPGALITPQAKDDAKSYGIAILTQEASVSTASSVSPVAYSVAQGTANPTGQFPVQGMPAGHVAMVPNAVQHVAQHTPLQGYGVPYGTPQVGVGMHMNVPAPVLPAQATGTCMSPVAGHGVMPMPTLAATAYSGTSPAYASTQQQRVIMNNPSTLDPNMQQLVEQVLKAVAPAAQQVPACSPAPMGGATQGVNPAFVATQVTQQLNSLLASRGGIAAFPGMEATIASIVAEYTGQAQYGMATPHVMTAPVPNSGTSMGNSMGGAPVLAGQSSPLPHAAPVNQGNIAGINVVPFVADPPKGRVQGEVSIEEALLPGNDGPGVTRFTFADTSLVWTFTQAEVLIVTHGTIEVQGAGGVNTLGQGAAIRVASGTSVTLVAQGPASCVTVAWPSK